MNSTLERKTNYPYIEILRVISALAVIVVHVSGANWFRIEIGSANWVVQTFFNLAGRYSVCVFCMISARCFSDRRRSRACGRSSAATESECCSACWSGT